MGNCGAKQDTTVVKSAAPTTSGSGTKKKSVATSAPKKKPVQKKTSNLLENLIAEKHSDFNEIYEVVERVGEGSISNISTIRRKDTGDTGVLYALKEIDYELVKPEFLEEMHNEIALMKTLDHPNIIKAYETYDVPPKILAIVMELCTGGDLNARGPYTELEVAKIIGKLVAAVNYLHKNKIIHRDIKFENIMFENETPEAEVKLIDFGLSTRYTGESNLTDRVGTVYTMSPQVMKGDYTEAADLWSIGVVCYQLLAGEPPFWANSRKEIIQKVRKAEYNFNATIWKFVSKEAKDFIRHLIEVDPVKRWTAAQALKSKWLKKHQEVVHTKTDAELAEKMKLTMDDYAKSTDVKKLALHMIARKSTTDEIFQLRAAFDEFDVNDDGIITYKEFQTALTALGFEKSDVDKMFRSVDVDGSGEINYTEFLASTLEAHGRVTEQRIAEAFEQFDADGSGLISRDEVAKILGKDSSDEYIEKLMAEADLNGDGQISYEEFRHAFQGKTTADVERMKAGG